MAIDRMLLRLDSKTSDSRNVAIGAAARPRTQRMGVV
jgi:hypothetical protein